MATQLASERSTKATELGDQPGRPLCILILGMHRSGTSVLAGVLGLLGAALPKNPIPPNSSNTKGFFEPEIIVALHDEMLSSLGSSWLDFRRLNPSKFDSLVAQRFKARLVAALRDEYGDPTKFVVKDPRICRFFPFWRDVAGAFGADERIIFVFRNPIEVTRSLAKRDKLSHGYCMNLWLRHILDAEFDTRNSKRLFISYDDLMNDWKRAIKKIEGELDVKFSDLTPEVQVEVEGLIDRDMRHHATDKRTFALECRDQPLVLKAYHAIEKLTRRNNDPEAMAELDEVRRSFDESINDLGYSLESDLIYVQTKLYLARSRIEKLEAQAREIISIKESQTREVNSLKEDLRRAQSCVRDLEASLAEQEIEMIRLNSQLLAIEDSSQKNLSELEDLRKLREVDQERILKLGSQLEQVWVLEFQQRNEQRKLQEQIARLTTEAASLARELKFLKSGLSWRLSKPFRLVSQKLRGLQF